MLERTHGPLTGPDEGTLTVQEWVYRELKERILIGQFVPGRSVTLRGIATMLDVSPTPVREALRRLVSERALEVHGNRRVSVPTMTRRKFDDLCAARVALETLAAERALPAMDADRLAQLRRLDAETDAAVEQGDVTRYLERHRAFHYTLYTSGSAEVLMPLIESVWLQFSPFLRLVVSHIGVDYIVDRHAEALNALERGDPPALRFAIEADVREGLGSLSEADWRDLDAATRAQPRGDARG
ncbi:MAG: GntR family transcriptional regulator [Proteobacteria bacterium SW_6_67_9]|nr:MAG: GntR family transcriptional regulator [Proteobacteria bacterium SW_6_67_9]